MSWIKSLEDHITAKLNSSVYLFYCTRPNFVIVVDENDDELVIKLEEPRILKTIKNTLEGS